MKISTTIITLNEEKHIKRCINSVKPFSDEIVVVDSGSSDETVKIAKRAGTKVFTHTFKNFADQKNYAASKTKHTWIFSIDADEEVTKELQEEILQLNESDTIAAFSIPRRNYILGEFIKYTRWQPELDRHIWLFNKNKARWDGDIHEEIVVEGTVGKLKAPKNHYQYETVREFVEMMNSYSEIESKQKHDLGIRFRYVHLLVQPVYNFSVRYIYRLGFLDGWRGFVLSYLMGIYHFQVWAKLWSLYEKTK